MATTRLLAYQSLFSLVQQVSFAATSQHDALGAHYDAMFAGHSISAIVKSRHARTTLLQIATDLGIYGDARLRNALSEDEQRIANYISSILESESERAAVLQLTGDSAQYFLDVVQMVTVDRGLLLEKQHNAKARRMIIKLSEACDELPSSLFISGITRRDEHATFGGGFGDIYQASYGGKTVALKLLRVFQADEQQRQIRLKFCREALVWQHLRHPFILPLIGIDRETFPSSLCMVSPWMEHGTVLKYLNEYGRANVDKLLHEIAQALQYLHSQNIIHGDLRGANILITPEWSACLADFGLTSLADTTATTRSSRRAGSVRWMAPELIYPAHFKRKFVRTRATDVYAFGCVCLELYTGQPPFPDLSETVVMFDVLKGDRPDRPSGEPAMSDVLWELVNDCWTQEPETRPTIQAVVEKLSSDPEMTSMSNAEIINVLSTMQLFFPPTDP
ncbi:Kinase-like protein [Mycena sanguinolenta]|uniref:Kinase-like protein n=1 Tax=Mycena sanguinolenta TaxID=230812 RepID=A0A8H7DHQ3_9AGAR|nr:Kinase-like protein [Mycena sanguinolenta]